MSDYFTDPLAGLVDEAGNPRPGVTRADLAAARRRLSAEMTQAMLRQSSPTVTEPASPSYSDRELALQVLQTERGMNELAAFRILEREGITDELRPEVERLRDLRTRSDQERAERARSESEQGRLAAAADAHDAARREAERVEMGRALLRQDPERHGVSPEMIADLTPTEVLHASGIEQTADEANDPAANRARAEGSDAA